MPIYEYYSPQTNKIYQFYAKTLAQGQTTPKCPDNPKFKMVKIPSTFAIRTGETSLDDEKPQASPNDDAPPAQTPQNEAHVEAAMDEIARDIDRVDENDPRAMARMIRKMAEASGEPIDAQMEEVVRKLEEGTDPEKLEEQLGSAFEDEENPNAGSGGGDFAGFGTRRPMRDPNLYDY